MAHSAFSASGVGAAQAGETIAVPGSGTGSYILHNNSDATVTGTITSTSSNITFDITEETDRRFFGIELVNNNPATGNDFLTFRAYPGGTAVFEASKSDAGDGDINIATGAATSHGTSANEGEQIFLGRV